MSKIREKLIEVITKLDENESLYKDYEEYVKEQLAQKSPNILSYHDWAMENDENYRDEVLDSDDYYNDTWEDTTDQERFDDKLSMYDIAGING